MGRTLKRVPMDFDWPLKVVWKGYCSPYRATECKTCGGSGYNPKTRKLSEDWYDSARTGMRWCDKLTQDEVDALVESGRFRERVGDEWVSVPRTAEEVNAANLNHAPWSNVLLQRRFSFGFWGPVGNSVVACLAWGMLALCCVSCGRSNHRVVRNDRIFSFEMFVVALRGRWE